MAKEAMTPQETIAHLQSQLDECRKERQARELAVWVPIGERLPVEADADCDGRVWIWAPFYIPDPEGRFDDDERKFVLGGYKAWREQWDHIRIQKPTHWMPSTLRRPAAPASEQPERREGGA